MEKILKDLSWSALAEQYKIGTVKFKGELLEINELEEAIKNGEILAKLQMSADQLHAGDLSEAVRNFRRNLSSQLCNMNKADYRQSLSTDLIRYNLLEGYTKQFVGNISSNKLGKAKWLYTTEDIMSLEGDYEELRKLYNSMYDKLNKYEADVLKVTTRREYDAKLLLCKELRDDAKKIVETEKSNKSNALLDKLQAGKNLSAEDKAALIELLSE